MANTKVTKAVLADDAVGLAQLDITNDPSDGQALTAAVNPNGYDLTWASVGVSGISSSADATAITIDSSERVGINQATPTQTVHVGDGTSNYVMIENASSGDVSSGFLIQRGTGTGAQLYDNPSDNATTLLSAGKLNFIANGSGTNLHISTAGTIGIGTTSPTTYYNQGVHIRGTNNAAIKFTNDDTGSTNDDGVDLALDDSEEFRIINRENKGVSIYTNAAVRFTISAEGYITAPKQPAFGGGRNAGHKAEGNVYVADFQRTNDDSHYNTSNGRFTAPVTGRYYVFGNIMTHDSGSAGHINWSIRKNGSDILYAYDYKDGATHSRCVGAWVIPLTANDYIEWYLNSDSGASGWYGTAHEYGSIGAFLIG